MTDTKPVCPYCGTTEGLRIKCDGGGYEAPEYTCEACFTGTDDGPSFDDLKPAQPHSEQMNATAAHSFHSLAPIGFAGLEHSEVLMTPKGRKFIWLRAIGEEAVEVELPKAFEDKVRLFARFASVMPISVQS